MKFHNVYMFFTDFPAAWLSKFSKLFLQFSLQVAFLSGFFSLSLISCSSLQTKIYEISYDKKKILYREEFLAEKPKHAEKQPNIVLILADDLGQMDLKLYTKLYGQGGGLSMPNIERIAANGVTFKDAYVTSGVCAPSRAALLTGRYHQRYGYEFMNMERYPQNRFQESFIRKFIDTGYFTLAEIPEQGVPNKLAILQQGLPLTEITLASLLKKNGYTTGIIGKWHLSDYRNKELAPQNRGFDYHYGFYGSHSLYTHKQKTKAVVNVRVPNEFSDPILWRSKRKRNSRIFKAGEKIVQRGYLTYEIADEAVAFIERNKDTGSPFFLYLPFNAPHTPLQAPKDLFEKYSHASTKFTQVYAAMIEAMDTAIGKVLDSLEKHSLEENTLIFFLSDNGAALYTRTSDNGILRAGKMTLFNGGLSIPFLMQWKGKIKPGSVYTPFVSSLDVFSTAAKAASAVLPPDRSYDGIELLSQLNTNKSKAEHASGAGAAKRSLFFRVYKNKSVRDGDWKLLINGWDNSESLFNLANDVAEQKNLIKEYPLKHTELLNKLAEFEKEVPFNPLWPRVMDVIHKEKGKEYRFSF